MQKHGYVLLTIVVFVILLFSTVGIAAAQEWNDKDTDSSSNAVNTTGNSEIFLPLLSSSSLNHTYSLSLADQGYPLIEEFDSAEGFTFTNPSRVYIADGQVHWNVSRSAGQQYLYRQIPEFSGDVRLTVKGQINSWNNNCGIDAGIGSGFDESGFQSGVAVNFSFTGGGCSTNGPNIRATGVALDQNESYCNFTGTWLWINGGMPYTPELTIADGAVDLIVPGVGSVGGTPVYDGVYNTLFVGTNGTGDWPSCSGTIDKIVVEPLGTSGPSIEGIAEDGEGNRLVEADVELLTDGEVIDSTVTNSEGVYKFPDKLNLINPGEYSVRMYLRHSNISNGEAILQVHYGNKRFIFFEPILVSVESNSFNLSSESNVNVPINFGSSSLKTHSSIPKENLDDLARIYFHSMQVITFGRDVLNVNHDFELPIKMFAYRDHNENSDTYYDKSSGDIYMRPASSDKNYKFSRESREWHELFHELMDDTIGMPPLAEGDENHGGFTNSSTSDSWVEGWAEFWTQQLAVHLEIPDPNLFRFGGKSIDFEYNWIAPSYKNGLLEEFAVASLLWDLVDDVDIPNDDDPIEIEVDTLWEIIGSKELNDMKEVYDELVNHKVGSEVSSPTGLTDLDILFAVHGFYVDNGNKTFDLNEEIGRAANTTRVRVYTIKNQGVWVDPRPLRRSLQLIPGTNILVNVIDKNGNPLVEGKLEASVVFQESKSYYNYNYSVDLKHVYEGLLDMHPPPSIDSVMVQLFAVGPTGEKSDTLIINNEYFWDNIQVLHPDYVAIHEFEIGNEGITTDIVKIDIKPGSYPNSINCNNDNGVVPVAILTNSNFDALNVDHRTVTFQGTGETHLDQRNGLPKRHEEDVDNDGDMDLVLHFRKGETDLTCSSYAAILKGMTYDGLAIEGFDSVRMVPEKKR